MYLEKRDIKEDATKYGEFVCSNYHWVTLDEQKKIAKKMENMTKKEKNKENESK